MKPSAAPLTLPDKMRLRFSESQRFLFACVLCGLLCGLMAVLFHLGIHTTFHYIWTTSIRLTSHHPWLFTSILLACPCLGGLICGLAIRYQSPEAAGSGIPQTKEAYYNRQGVIPLSLTFWRVALGTIFVGLGNALGREGPIVHASSSIASSIGRWMFRDVERARAMIPVGMAAGIGAAFNAPLSALTFVFEELLDNFSTKAIGGMVVAVVIAAAVSRSILGEDPVISTHLSLHYETQSWMLIAIPLGAIAGIFGHLFVQSIRKTRLLVRHTPWIASWYAPALGGLLCGCFGLVTWWTTGELGRAEHGVFSIGYESLEAAFENQLILPIISALLFFKFLAVVFNYGTGGSGGLFSPTLFLGGMLGGIVGMGLVYFNGSLQLFYIADQSQIIGACVLLGMGALFSAVIRCPFTSLIIIFEMTGNYSLILPLMGGNMLAWVLSRRLLPIALYDSLLLDDGITLKHMPSYRGAQDYRNLPVSTIMTHDIATLQFALSPEENLAIIHRENTLHHAYPILDEHLAFKGIITHHELLDADPDLPLEKLIEGQETISVFPDTSIRQASRIMIERDIHQLPILSAKHPDKLLGLLTLNDIARQQNAAEI